MQRKLSLGTRYGLAITGSLVGYFLLLSLFGLHTKPLFSLFNAVIMGFGIYDAIKVYRLRKGDAFSYASGFRVGVVTGFVATILFTFFFAVYAGNIEPTFMEELLAGWTQSNYTSIGALIFTVAIGGFTTALCATLTIMQRFKPSWNTTAVKQTSKL